MTSRRAQIERELLTNLARPKAGTRLCAVADLIPGEGKTFRYRVEFDLFTGAIFHHAGQVFGYVDSCPHAGWPLGVRDDHYLTVDRRHILCAGHAALFDFEGLCIAGPCEGEHLVDWPIEIRDGEVFAA